MSRKQRNKCSWNFNYLDATVDPSRSHTAGLQTAERQNRLYRLLILIKVWITTLKHQSTLKHMEVGRKEKEVIKKTLTLKRSLGKLR